jgi:hypothetical protein
MHPAEQSEVDFLLLNFNLILNFSPDSFSLPHNYHIDCLNYYGHLTEIDALVPIDLFPGMKSARVRGNGFR